MGLDIFTINDGSQQDYGENAVNLGSGASRENSGYLNRSMQLMTVEANSSLPIHHRKKGMARARVGFSAAAMGSRWKTI